MTCTINKITEFHFKTWHFGMLFAILLVLTNIIDTMIINNTPQITQHNTLTEINDKTFDKAISQGINFVLFYQNGSTICNKMEYNLHQIENKNNIKYKDFNFYKLNFDKHPGKYSDYPVSGTPCIIIYKNGKEIERIMGIVSTSNIEVICNRILK